MGTHIAPYIRGKKAGGPGEGREEPKTARKYGRKEGRERNEIEK